jgi:hypothetical protein
VAAGIIPRPGEGEGPSRFNQWLSTLASLLRIAYYGLRLWNL